MADGDPTDLPLAPELGVIGGDAVPSGDFAESAAKPDQTPSPQDLPVEAVPGNVDDKGEAIFKGPDRSFTGRAGAALGGNLLSGAAGALRSLQLSQEATGYDPLVGLTGGISGLSGGVAGAGPQSPPPDEIQADAKESLARTKDTLAAWNSYNAAASTSDYLATTLGTLAGGFGSPENLVFPELRVTSAAWTAAHPLLSRVVGLSLGQSVVQTAADGVKQAAEIKAKFASSFDPVEAASAMLVGAGFGLGVGAVFEPALKAGANAAERYLARRAANRFDHYAAGIAQQDQAAMPRSELSPELTPRVDLPRQEPPPPAVDLGGPHTVEVPVEAPDVQGAPAGSAARLGQVEFPEPPVKVEKGKGQLTASFRNPDDSVTTYEVGKNDSGKGYVARRAVEDESGAGKEVLTEAGWEPEPERPPAGEVGGETDLSGPPVTPRVFKTQREALEAVRDSHFPTASAETAARLAKSRGATGLAVERGNMFPSGAAAPQSGPVGEQKLANVMDIMRRLADALDATVRVGRVAGRGNLGSFDFRGGVARIKDIGDIATFAHEVLGHHLEKMIGAPLTQLIQRNEAALRNFLGPVSRLFKTKAAGSREGFAEFMASFLTDPHKAQINAPAFYRDFQTIVAQHAPDVMRAIRDAQVAFSEYRNATALESVMSNIVTNSEIPTTVDHGDPLARTRIDVATADAVRATIDETDPLRRLVTAIVDKYREQNGRLMSVGADEDPHKIVQVFKQGGNSGGFADLSYGVQSWNPDNFMEPSSPDVVGVIRSLFTDPTGGGAGRQITDAVTGKVTSVRYRMFGAYLTAKRVVAVEPRIGRQLTPNTLAQHIQAIKDIEAQFPDFIELAQRVYEFQAKLLEKEVAAGTRSASEAAELLKDKDNYVPLYRDMRRITEDVAAHPDPGKGILESLGRHKLKGSDQLPILHPLENIIRRTFIVNDQIRQNYAINALRDVAARVKGVGHLVEEIPNTVIRKFEVDTEESLYNGFVAAGHDAQDARDLARQIIHDFQLDQRLAVYRTMQIEGQRPIIFGWRNGERFALRLPDGEFGRHVFEVFDVLGPNGTKAWAAASKLHNDIFAIASQTTAQLLRQGATGTITFMWRNLVRDPVMQFLMVPEAGIFATPARMFRGLAQYFTSGDTYKMYTGMGGIQGGVTATAIQRGKDIASVLKAAGVKRHHIFTFDNLEKFVKGIEFSETTGRLGLFDTVYRANIRSGRTARYAAFDAAHKARDFVDYGRRGSRTVLVSKLIPFMNANIQGLNKFYRVYGKQLIGGVAHTKEEQQAVWQARLWLGSRATALATLSGALAYMYHDDPQYRRLSPQMRSSYWIFRSPLGKGKYKTADGDEVDLPEGMQGAWILIPKPWEPGAIFNFFEKVVEYHMGDPNAGMNFLAGLPYSFNIPNPLDIPFVRNNIELESNRDTYFKRPIVPDYLQRVAPHFQYTDRTMKFYVSLAATLNELWDSKSAHDTLKDWPLIGPGLASLWSPMEAEHFVRGVVADMPRELGGAINVVNSLLHGEAPDVSDIPGLRGFVYKTVAGGEPLRQFWGYMAQNSGDMQVALNTYNMLVQQRRDADAINYRSHMTAEQKDFVDLNQLQAGANATLLHPLERTRVVEAELRKAMNELTRGVITDSQDQEHQVSVDPHVAKTLIEVMHELTAYEAQNGLIALGDKAFSDRETIKVQHYYDVIKNAAPDVYNELMNRYALRHIYPIETVEKYYPKMQRALQVYRSDPDELRDQIKDIGTDAADAGYFGGGDRVGRTTYSPSGDQLKRPKGRKLFMP